MVERICAAAFLESGVFFKTTGLSTINLDEDQVMICGFMVCSGGNAKGLRKDVRSFWAC
ncbi:hypothetical protein [Bartonella gliris]|uniref:hypothetical protein n=1 Tax=Bartonella gliris TaxID=3004109 RepID=UPI003873846D